MQTTTLHKLIWALIFGGLLLLSLGLFVQRVQDLLGLTMVAVGAAAAATGAVLIWWRSRMPG